MPAKIIVRNLSKRYRNVQAVSDVSFEIASGEIFGLLGPNGAGKTTTVESAIGLIEPDEGTVEICGIDVRRQPREAKQKIGAALQTTGLQDQITPREALRVFGSFYRTPAGVQSLLDRFALSSKADAAFHTLSGGQKQRLALALAFVNNPEAVFLDEPTAGLDLQMRRELHGHIREMKREGRSVLLTTHDMEEAEQLCDRIAVLDGGRIVAEGTPHELIAGSQSAMCVSFQTNLPLNDDWPLHLPHAGEIVCDDSGSGRFTTSNVNRALAELIEWLDTRQIEIANLRAGRATLEDVIFEITGSDPGN